MTNGVEVMACLEHRCRDCDFVWLDNQPCKECPKCGGKVITHWDEVADRDDEMPWREGD